MKKICIKSDFKEILLKLATNGQSDKAFLLTSNVVPKGLSAAPALGLYTCIKSLKMCKKSDFKVMFLKLATNGQCDKALSVDIKTLSPGGLPLPWGYTHAKGIFLELVQNDGNDKSFQMLPELVPSGCMPMSWGYIQCLSLPRTSCEVSFTGPWSSGLFWSCH